MPIWVSAYLSIYVMYSLWAVINDIKFMNEWFWYSAAEIVADALLLLAALSFWSAPIRDGVGQLILPTFTLGLTLLIAQTVRSLWHHVATDKELSLQGKLFVGLSGSFLIIAFCTPLIYWGFNVALLGNHAST